MKNLHLGTLAGLKIIVLPSAVICFFALWIIFALIGLAVFKFSAVESILGGLAAAVLHYLCELLHNLGHSWAARRTGYPMTGIAFWMVIGKSLYPRDEPELPAAIHIRRALGGPMGSLLASIVAGIIALVLLPGGGLPAILAVFFFVDNFFFFTLGAFLPVPILDGGTILHWWGKR